MTTVRTVYLTLRYRKSDELELGKGTSTLSYTVFFY